MNSIFPRLLQPHKNRPTTTELCEIVSKLHSSNGHIDVHPTEAQNQSENIDTEGRKDEIKTTESESNSSATYDTTTIIESIQQVSVSMGATANEKIEHNQNKNNENSTDRENVHESFDADATGDDNNDSILASVASIDDKDKLIEFLTNKLMEKNRKESEMSQEIERLRNLLK